MLFRFSIFLLLLLPLVASIFYGEDGFGSDSGSNSYGGGPRYNDDDNQRPPPRPTCEDGWKFFQRPSGGWCMKVYPGTMNQYNSETMCVSQGAVLSGLQNIAEVNWLVSSALTVIAPQTSGSVWIGIRRRPECIRSRITATCTRTNSFYWTDNSATGIEGMVFQQGEPNNQGSNRAQDCAMMTVATTPTIRATGVFWSGQMDDMMCDTSSSSNWLPGTQPRLNRAYVCGKKAGR